MAEIILNFNSKPPVMSYNHHAFGTGIITTAKSGINWIYNNYINMSYYSEQGPLAFEFYMDYIYCQPVFERENISDSILRNLKYDCIDLIEAALRQGKYFICCVDEYYIPEREAYGRYHFNHNLLIYGVNTTRKEFYTAGYNESGLFATQKISFKAIKNASINMINLLTLREDEPYKLFPHYIQHQILQYNKEYPLDPVGSFSEGGRLVGVDAVDRMLEDICLMAMDGEPVDVRPVCLLFEQRKLMTDRVRELIQQGYDIEDVSDCTDMMLHQVEVLKKRILIYNMRCTDKDVLALKDIVGSMQGQILPHILRRDTYDKG